MAEDFKDLDGEEWRDVKGYEGLYQVSNLGRVRRLNICIVSHGVRHEIPKITLLKSGGCGRDRNYEAVGLFKDGRRYRHRVHRLVANAFILNPKGLPMVDHINRDKSDNRVENLRWCDGKENRRNCDYNLFYTINGETKILEDWCEQYGIGRSTVKYRLNKGLDIISALTNPIMTKKEARACRKA